MLQIPHKTVYHLLDQHFSRTSLNNYINEVVGEDAFKASILFAKQNEQYSYLADLVENRNSLEKEFVVFVNYDEVNNSFYPIILPSQDYFDLDEICDLAYVCKNIDNLHFIHIVEAVADRFTDIDTEKVREEFEQMLQDYPVTK